MATLQKMVWDIRRILRSTTDDTKIKDLHLIEKINHYRALAIEKQYEAYPRINPEWIQSLKDQPLTQVATGDIPGFAGKTDLKFGKLTYPPILFSNVGRLGLFRVSGTSNWNRYTETDIDSLQIMIQISDWRLQHYGYFFPLGNDLYFYNSFGNVNLDLILGNPMDGFIYNTVYVNNGDLVADQNYLVKGSQIIYNAITYDPGDIIIGQQGVTTYIGPGKIVKYPEKRAFAWTDNYPVDEAMAQEIVWMVLTKDYQIENKMTPDVLNDASEATKIR